MKGCKLILCLVLTFIAIAAAFAAIVVFRNEIACFIADIKEKIDEKIIRRNGEYEDYVD